VIAACVIDASVAIKWVLPEQGSETARRLLDARLVAPDLLLVECANILWKHVRRGELHAAAATARLASLLLVRMESLPTSALVSGALSRAVQHRHPAYDCVYLEAACHSGLPLVTADRALARLAGDGAEVLLLDSFA